MIRSRLRQAKRGSSGFNFPGAPFPVSFAYDFLSSANPVIGGGTTTTTIDADGTFVNSAGLITQKTANVWPLDYSPSTLQPLGRPVWEARTNLLLRSAEFDNASWTKTDTTITANSIVSPDGTQNADLFTEGSAGTAEVTQAVTATADAVYTCTAWAKYGNHQWIRTVIASGANSVQAYFDIQNGAVGTTTTTGTGASVTRAIESFGNGWFRIRISGSVGSGSTAINFSLRSATGNGNATRVSGGTRYHWGAQFENNTTFATSYIPTAGTSVTRAADNLSIALGSWFNATEGTWLVEFIPGAPSPTTAAQVFIVVSNGTIGEIYSYYRIGLTGNTGVYVVDGGAPQVNITNAGVTTTNAISKVATAYRVNDFSWSVNGAVPATDGTATLPTPITLYLGSTNNTDGYLNGWLRKLAYYPVRYNDARLQLLSAP